VPFPPFFAQRRFFGLFADFLRKIADFPLVSADSSKMSRLTGCRFKFHRRFFSYFLTEMQLFSLFFYFSPISCTFPLIYKGCPPIFWAVPPIFSMLPLIPKMDEMTSCRFKFHYRFFPGVPQTSSP